MQFHRNHRSYYSIKKTTLKVILMYVKIETKCEFQVPCFFPSPRAYIWECQIQYTDIFFHIPSYFRHIPSYSHIFLHIFLIFLHIFHIFLHSFLIFLHISSYFLHIYYIKFIINIILSTSLFIDIWNFDDDKKNYFFFF